MWSEKKERLKVVAREYKEQSKDDRSFDEILDEMDNWVSREWVDGAWAALMIRKPILIHRSDDPKFYSWMVAR